MFVSVLGIDPGLTRCGYGVVRRNEKRTCDLVNVGIFTTSPQAVLSERLAEMHRDLSALISEVKPDYIAIEQVFFQNNVSTAMSVAQVSGLVHSIAAAHSIPVTEYTPTQVKSAITGDGTADKVQVQTMVTRLLNLKVTPKPADAADALAIALTHAYAVSGLSAKKKAGSDSDSAIYNGSNLHNAIADALTRQTKKFPVKRSPQVRERTEKLERERVRKRSGLAR